jgi:hypothetical protein
MVAIIRNSKFCSTRLRNALDDYQTDPDGAAMLNGASKPELPYFNS